MSLPAPILPFAEPLALAPTPAEQQQLFPIAVRTLIDEFLADQRAELAPATHADYARVLGQLAERFGSRDPRSLRNSEVRAWILGQQQWQAPTTRWGVALKIKRLLNWAVKDNALVSNPLRGLEIAKGERRPLTTEAELEALLRAASAPFQRVLYFLRYTGGRPELPRNLRVEWVDLAEGVALIPPKAHKAGKRTRRPLLVVLGQAAVALLREVIGRRTEGVVFRNSRGRPWSRTAFAQRLAIARRAAGLPASVTLHGIRHLYGTVAIARGAPLKLVSQGMGHKHESTTEDYYLHTDPALVAALRKVSDLAARRELG